MIMQAWETDESCSIAVVGVRKCSAETCINPPAYVGLHWVQMSGSG